MNCTVHKNPAAIVSAGGLGAVLTAHLISLGPGLLLFVPNIKIHVQYLSPSQLIDQEDL